MPAAAVPVDGHHPGSHGLRVRQRERAGDADGHRARVLPQVHQAAALRRGQGGPPGPHPLPRRHGTGLPRGGHWQRALPAEVLAAPHQGLSQLHASGEKGLGELAAPRDAPPVELLIPGASAESY